MLHWYISVVLFVQFFLMLNAAAAANSVECPMYVQWAGSEVLTCRTAAERWRTQSHDYIRPAAQPSTWHLSLGLGDIQRALWVLLFGRRGAEEGSRSSQYVTKEVANSCGSEVTTGWSVRGRLRKLREFKWEEVKDGAMHVMIHGRRGPALVACIRNWILQQIAASAAERGCTTGGCAEHGGVHEYHACSAALEEHKSLAAAGSSVPHSASGGHRGAEDEASQTSKTRSSSASIPEQVPHQVSPRAASTSKLGCSDSCAAAAQVQETGSSTQHAWQRQEPPVSETRALRSSSDVPVRPPSPLPPQCILSQTTFPCQY